MLECSLKGAFKCSCAVLIGAQQVRQVFSLHLIIELNQAKNKKRLLEEERRRDKTKAATNGEGKVMKQTTSGPKPLRNQSAPVNKSSSN